MNRLMNTRFVKISLMVAVCLVWSVALTGCKSKKKALEKPAPEALPVSELMGKVHTASFQPEWFSGKAGVTFTQKKSSNSFTANIRIQKDKVIWASITPGLGIEVARVILTPDSIKLVNRFDKTYVQRNFAYLSNLLQAPLEFQHVQALLMGNHVDFFPEIAFASMETTPANFVLSTSRKDVNANGNNQGKSVRKSMHVNALSYRPVLMEMEDMVAKKKIVATYSDFSTINSQSFANQNQIVVHAEDNVELDLRWSKLSTEGPLEFPFSIPANYEPMH